MKGKAATADRSFRYRHLAGITGALMTPNLASLALPFLQRLDPERAHDLSLHALRLGLAGSATAADPPSLGITLFGRRFANPIGLAAGFDKNAHAARALMRLGFGFVETGTVTPRPQVGNPRPRLFRLASDRAVINRMGFNNAGLDPYLRQLAALRDRRVPVGANVGINKEGADPIRDYPALVAAVSPFVDYVVINVSSPNTPGLRDLQAEGQLRAILQAIANSKGQPPLFVKVAPDLSRDGLAGVVETSVENGVQGLILGNTTVSRPAGLQSPLGSQAGGLSGEPLFALSTRMLAQAFLLARGRLVLIGTGGVFTGRDALTKIRAGASLVQLYTAFAYHGPALIPRIKSELVDELRRAGFVRLEDAVGSAAPALAEG